MVDGGTLPDPNPQSPNPLDLDVFQVPRGQTTTSAVWSGLIHFCPIFNERILDVFHYRTLMTECYKQLLCKKMPCSHFYDHAIFTCTIFSAKMWDVLFATKKQPHWNDLEEKKGYKFFQCTWSNSPSKSLLIPAVKPSVQLAPALFFAAVLATYK